MNLASETLSLASIIVLSSFILKNNAEYPFCIASTAAAEAKAVFP